MAYKYHPDIKDEYDKLKSLPEFQFNLPVSVDMDSLIRYIIFLYDKDSDLKRLHQADINLRKREAAKQAGFELNDKGRFDKDVEDILIGENNDVNRAIVGFVRQFYDPYYVMYVSVWELFANDLSDSMKVNDPGIRKVIGENLDKRAKQIMELEEKILGEKETDGLRRALYATMESERLGLRPEDVVHALHEKRFDPGVDPYRMKAKRKKK